MSLDQEHAVAKLLDELVGFDAQRMCNDHFEDTPARFIKMLKELTTPEPFSFTTFDSECDDMVTVKDIAFYTLCAHHVIPFFGKVHVGYVPNGKIVGLSKIPRAVSNMAKGLWAQEELTSHIADFLEARLDPKGVAVVIEARHLCMEMRGIKAYGAFTTTSSMRGVFSDHTRLARQEFLSLVNNGR